MNTLTGGSHVPVTVRTLSVRSLAAGRLAHGGSIECDVRGARQRSVNWLALALLLGAWNVEARLQEPPPQDALKDVSPETAGWPPGGFDWTEPRESRWASCAAHDGCRRGA